MVQALQNWKSKMVRKRPDLVKIGYFGSYARGDWGVGSDVDLLIVIERSDQPFARRAEDWETEELPVSADVLVYTMAEWQSLKRQRRFGQTLERELMWLYDRHQS